MLHSNLWTGSDQPLKLPHFNSLHIFPVSFMRRFLTLDTRCFRRYKYQTVCSDDPEWTWPDRLGSGRFPPLSTFSFAFSRAELLLLEFFTRSPERHHLEVARFTHNLKWIPAGTVSCWWRRPIWLPWLLLSVNGPPASVSHNRDSPGCCSSLSFTFGKKATSVMMMHGHRHTVWNFWRNYAHACRHTHTYPNSQASEGKKKKTSKAFWVSRGFDITYLKPFD